MKRLIAILGLVAAVAVSVGAASVLAHDGGDQGQNTTNACTMSSVARTRCRSTRKTSSERC